MDGTSAEEVKKPARKLGRQDDLVEQLKAEFKDVGASTPVIPSDTVKDGERGNLSEKIKIATSSSTSLPAGRQARNDETGSSTRQDDKKVKTQKPGKVKPRSKKYQELTKDLDKSKTYPLNEAVEMTKKMSMTKFDGTIEAHINTIQTGIRGLVSLPFVSGKKLKILVFGSANTPKADEDITIGDESIIETINKGKVNFDLVITTPDWMPKLAKVARILGPRSLMPNPKNGTIVSDLKKAVESFQTGKIEYKTESKAAVMHLGLGKLSQPTEELSANIKTLLATLGKSRVKKVSLSPTMGPSVKLDLTSL